MVLITSAHLVEANNLMTTTQVEAKIAKNNCDVMLILSDGSEYVCMVSIDDGKTWQEYTPAILATLLAGAAAWGALLWRRRKKGVESAIPENETNLPEEDLSDVDWDNIRIIHKDEDDRSALDMSNLWQEDTKEESVSESVIADSEQSSVEEIGISTPTETESSWIPQEKTNEDINTAVENPEKVEEQSSIPSSETSIEPTESANIDSNPVSADNTELIVTPVEGKKPGIFERLKNRFGRLFGSSKSDKVITESQSSVAEDKIDEIPNSEIASKPRVRSRDS